MNEFTLSAGGFTVCYERNGQIVKRTAIGYSDGTAKGGETNRSLSSWQWTGEGWKGQGSRSGQGYIVAKHFGFI